jgi:hypothetical protein
MAANLRARVEPRQEPPWPNPPAAIGRLGAAAEAVPKTDRELQPSRALGVAALTVPSDAVWTGVITGAVGVAGMAAVSLTALRLDRRRLRVERERVRREDDKEQRRERGAAYYRTVILLNRLDRFAAGDPPDKDTLSSTIDEYNKSVSALHLFGARPVLDALRDLQRLMCEVGESMASRSPGGDSLVDAFVEAWNDLREEIMGVERRLIVTMRQDVGPDQGDRLEPD